MNNTWYSVHTGTIKLWPYGFKLESNVHRVIQSRKINSKRGEINSFSKHAASRLKKFIIENYIPNKKAYSITLTTRKIFDKFKWLKIIKKFRNFLNRKKIPGIYRVELQKRKTPHLHCIFWLNEFEISYIYKGWMHAIEQSEMQHIAINCQELLNCTPWYMYMILHSSKFKKNQLGWKGKQWGIWCRRLFVKRNFSKIKLDSNDHKKFCRRIRNLYKKRLGKKYNFFYGKNYLHIQDNFDTLQLLRGLKCFTQIF